MLKAAFLAVLVLLVSTPAFSTSLRLSPESQVTEQTFTIYLNAADLENAKGLDIEITWDKEIIECSSLYFEGGALPGFSEFFRSVDNGIGQLEIVLLKISPGGYTGEAENFLVMTFDPVSGGEARIDIKRSYLDGDPVLIDDANNSIEVDVNSVTVTVPGGGPPTGNLMVELHQNYPNPFNPDTWLRFDVPQRSSVKLKIYDVSGKLVRTLIDGKEYPLGSWEVKWNGRNDKDAPVPSGIYFCLYEACGETSSRKLVILR